MAFTLDRLTLDDMDRAAVIHRTALDACLPWLPKLHTPAEDRAFFRDPVFTACRVWGAFDEALMGFIAFRLGWIDHLYVLPEHHGQGIGRALLGVAQDAFGDLQLWTFRQNTRARRFYERQGFVAVMETDGSRNEEREPDVLYRWQAPAS